MSRVWGSLDSARSWCADQEDIPGRAAYVGAAAGLVLAVVGWRLSETLGMCLLMLPFMAAIGAFAFYVVTAVGLAVAGLLLGVLASSSVHSGGTIRPTKSRRARCHPGCHAIRGAIAHVSGLVSPASRGHAASLRLHRAATRFRTGRWVREPTEDHLSRHFQDPESKRVPA